MDRKSEIPIEPSWEEVLKDEFEKEYVKTLMTTVREAYGDHESVFPPRELIFNAFALCPYEKVRVVILGQDPYHGKGQAHGLAFSVQDDVKVPPSLRNIYKEIQSDIGTPVPPDGDLKRWAQQGVLLLNTTLTVLEGKPASHYGLGWERFTDAVIHTLSKNKEHVVFLLWGKYAQEKAFLIDETKHLILTAPHPSPFSAHTGFFGCKHFSKANAYLEAHALRKIIW